MMREEGMDYQDVIDELEKAFNEDFHFEDGKVLGSMCTQPLDIAIDAHGMFIESNLGNPGLYPGTKRLEDEIVRMVTALLGGKDLTGSVLEGGTEANISALWIARNLTGRKEVVYPSTAHFSIRKACDILALRPRVIEVENGQAVNPSEVRRMINEDTAAVVGVAGTTELGMIDPIEELSELCLGKAWLHVDAAFGGFVIPFLRDLGYDVPRLDFGLEGISSLNMDGHKMGMSTIPSSVLLLREEEHLKRITFESPYLTSLYHASLLGTRSSAGVAALYATMKFLGRKGYRDIVKKCMENTAYMTSLLEERELSLVTKPVMNVLGIKLRDPIAVNERLKKMGWRVSVGRHPECLRIVLMPHVSKKAIDAFVEDLIIVARELGEL